MDADTRQIAAATLTTSDVDDASQVGALIDHVDGPVASFTADGAYDQEGVYGEVTARYPRALQRRAERYSRDSRQCVIVP